MTFVLGWLRGHDTDEVLFCCGFLADSVRRALGGLERSPWGATASSRRACWPRESLSSTRADRRRRPVANGALSVPGTHIEPGTRIAPGP